MRHKAAIKIGTLSLLFLIALSPALISFSLASVEEKEYSFVWSSESVLKWYGTKQQSHSSGSTIVKFMDGNYTVGEQVLIRLIDSSTDSWQSFQNITISQNMFQVGFTTLDWENETYVSGLYSDYCYLVYLPEPGYHIANSILVSINQAGIQINDRADVDEYLNFYSLIFTFNEYYIYEDELMFRKVVKEVTAEIDDDGVLVNYAVYVTKKDNNSSNESTQRFILRRRNKLENLLGITSSIGLVNLLFYGFIAIVIIYLSVDHFVKRKKKLKSNEEKN
jgi:hypothetical protein